MVKQQNTDFFAIRGEGKNKGNIRTMKVRRKIINQIQVLKPSGQAAFFVLFAAFSVLWSRYNTQSNQTPPSTTTPPTQTVDTTLPTIVSFSPTNSQTGVPLNASITATFSEAMDASSINTTNCTLINADVTIPATVTYNDTSRTATLNPTSSLPVNTLFTVTVTTSVKDTAGNSLAVPRVWTFTTGN
jgi:hypothetical protein